jgi:hypothetical protein
MVFALIEIVLMLFFLIPREISAPHLESMPPVVEESLETILISLENELAKHRPETKQSLRPGISLEELDEAQAILGQSIHPDMQAVYRWHNGLENDEELFFGYMFWDLDSAIQINLEFQKKGLFILLPHHKDWLILYPDAAGDGYYDTPQGSYDQGGVFYVFRETGYYRYFPSVKNFLMAIVECYQIGPYPQEKEPNYELEEQIMDKYGVVFEQP